MTFNTTWKKNKKKVKLISYNVAYKNVQTLQRYSVHCVNTRVTWKVCDLGTLADAETVKPVKQWSLSTHNTVCEGHHLLHHVTYMQHMSDFRQRVLQHQCSISASTSSPSLACDIVGCTSCSSSTYHPSNGYQLLCDVIIHILGHKDVQVVNLQIITIPCFICLFTTVAAELCSLSDNMVG